jgi:hypothetical protein
MESLNLIGIYDKSFLNNTNFLLKNNSLTHKETNITYNFDKIIQYQNLENIYNTEIIREIKAKHFNYSSKLAINSYILLGDCFNSYYNFVDLIKEIIFEYSVETFPFRLSIFEINYKESIDLISGNTIDDDNFDKIKIHLDPIDKAFKTKRKELLGLIETKLLETRNNKHIIFQIENIYQKNILYDLSDLSKNINEKYLSLNNYFIDNEISLLEIFFINVNNELPSEKKHKLTNFIRNNFKQLNVNKILFGINNNEKLLNLMKVISDSKNRHKKYLTSTEIIPYKSKEDTKQNFSLNSNIYKYKPVSPIVNPNKKNPLEMISIPPIPSNTPTFENLSVNISPGDLLRYLMKKDEPEIKFEKIKIFNKFIFDNCVRYHLKIQEANKNKGKIPELNQEMILNMKSMLKVILAQLELL